MSFPDLRRVLDQSLRQLPQANLNDLPCREADFLRLLKILEERMVADDPALKRHKKGKKLSFMQPRASVKAQKRLADRRQIIASVRRDIHLTFSIGPAEPVTQQVPWRVLPPGELSVKTVLDHYDSLKRRNPHIAYERDRVIMAFSLRPKQCYIGTDEFDGYIVLTFERAEKALLECPIVGNAIYIINNNWKWLARLTKQELLSDHAKEVIRVVHVGDWFSRARQLLGI